MPDRPDTKYSERDVILRERKAFERGYRTRPFEVWIDSPPGQMRPNDREAERLRAYIAGEYPLPPRVVPRVVTDPHPAFMQVWRWVGERLQWAPHQQALADQYWRDADLHARKACADPVTGCIGCITPERLTLFASLAANPTTTVPDDGSECR